MSAEPTVIQGDASELAPARSDQATAEAMEELRALTDVMLALRGISSDVAKGRILKAAASFFQISVAQEGTSSHYIPVAINRAQGPAPTGFAEVRTISPKEFLRDKQPRTDVERVACLAYFATHYRDMPHFKTIDLSKLNTEAAQPKLSNAAMAVDNAAKSGYLVPAAKGNKQISANGEVFVQALPDRDAARAAMTRVRPKKRRKKILGRTAEEVGDAE